MFKLFRLKQMFCRHHWEIKTSWKEAGDLFLLIKCVECGKEKVIPREDWR